MAANTIAHAFDTASETEKAELAHYLVRELSNFGLDTEDATVRQVVAALDRFSRPASGAVEDLG